MAAVNSTVRPIFFGRILRLDFRRFQFFGRFSNEIFEYFAATLSNDMVMSKYKVLVLLQNLNFHCLDNV